MDAATPRDIECVEQEHFGLGVGDKHEMLYAVDGMLRNRVWWLKRRRSLRDTNVNVLEAPTGIRVYKVSGLPNVQLPVHMINY